MKSELNLLLSSAGRRVELLNCFRADARELGLKLRVVATDLNPAMSAACRLADVSREVPRCDSPDFASRLIELCAAERIDLMIPTIDPELPVWASLREQLAGAGTRVVVSDPATIVLARDKQQTAEFLAAHGIPAPRTWSLRDFLREAGPHHFPVVVKPIAGSSSIGVFRATALEAIQRLNIDPSGYLVQEEGGGREFTVNQFYDAQGRLRASVPHWRVEVRAGEVSKAVTERQPQILAWAEQLGRVLPGARGPLCFQAMVDERGQGMVFEINARFGGGFPLTHRAGARFTRWLLEETAEAPDTAQDRWTAGVGMLRYDAAVFWAAPSP